MTVDDVRLSNRPHHAHIPGVPAPLALLVKGAEGYKDVGELAWTRWGHRRNGDQPGGTETNEAGPQPSAALGMESPVERESRAGRFGTERQKWAAFPVEACVEVGGKEKRRSRPSQSTIPPHSSQHIHATLVVRMEEAGSIMRWDLRPSGTDKESPGASSAPDSGTMNEDEVVVLVALVVVGSNPRHPQVGPDLAVRAPISEPRVRASGDANDQKA
ncbi:hypothetical protein FA13DRAFT_1718590 [Coprinellus micaceus]|uniref:Uncharacterized protein n=1 Tax=Coprinellus micaceus TaxID=71717 RepID=A0A4Y7SDP3_COPMI|nr:hypothetical protein FA13DRAFT_1718590 [Coprinellus micaceus]